jgi:hypothetical protein
MWEWSSRIKIITPRMLALSISIVQRLAKGKSYAQLQTGQLRAFSGKQGAHRELIGSSLLQDHSFH